MALDPYTRTSQDMLQQGARGEMFVNSGIPGHRNNDGRINRSNNQLNINDHDVLNYKVGLDPRLPSQFRYGWAYGYNQFVIPKGRIVAIDPHLMVMDTDTGHYFNAATIANGGKNVRLAQAKDFEEGQALEGLKNQAQFFINKVWVELEEELTDDEDFLRVNGGHVGVDGVVRKDVRPANIPAGILERNEYTRDADAFNGITFGPIRTDAIVQLPWFLDANKAMANPWGSVIGTLKPGDLVCSDENGRFVMSPLCKRHPDYAATIADMGAYEDARRQVVGEVYETQATLLPEGAARFAQWALEDRMNFKDFNPLVKATTNRAGEDFVENPPTVYQSTFEYPGYPYDRTAMTNDLHMLGSSREGMVNPRFDEAHRLDRGIPGLLDGYNAVVKAYGSSDKSGDTKLEGDPLLKVGHITVAANEEELKKNNLPYLLFNLPDTDLELAKVRVGSPTETDNEAYLTKEIAPGTTIDCGIFEIEYSDLHKGLFSLKQKEAPEDGTAIKKCPIYVSYVKRGQAGVPTNLDWDGCVGTVRILMNK